MLLLSKMLAELLDTSGTVGHVPFNLALLVSSFLRRSANKGVAGVAGN